MKTNLQLWLTLAGCAHFGILIASVLTPKVLQWRSNLLVLTPFLRQLFWVYGAFIFLTILGFGVITCAQAPALASGTPLARAVCGLIGTFWLARLMVQFFLFRPGSLLSNLLLKLGYHLLTVAFVAIVIIYGAAALL
jgi:hypothetical protein